MAADDGTVWLESNGQQFHVEEGSEAHERLIEKEAVVIDAPDSPKAKGRRQAKAEPEPEQAEAEPDGETLAE